MDKQYKELFILIAHTVSNIAEQVMELHKIDKDNEKQYRAAETMRNDYLNLYQKLNNDNPVMTKADYARLLVGSFIVVTQFEARIENEKKAIQGYKLDIIPKLDQINNESNEETALKLAEELFKIKEDISEENSNN